MFPSANYFRDIPCPFFSRVACPRPHCHFKHTQVPTQTSTNSTNTSSTSSLINIPPDANETLNKLINQLSTAATANSASATTTTTTTATSNPTAPIDITSLLQNTILQSLTAFATALSSVPQSTTTTTNNETSEKLTQALNTIASQLNQQQTQTPSPAKTAESVPEYRPTPIAELERRRRRVQQQTTKPNLNTDFESDDYVQATFSPPSSVSPPPPSSSAFDQPEQIETTNSTVSTATKSVQPVVTQSNSKQSTADDNHTWITPPIRRKLSSSSLDHNDFDERKPPVAKKVALADSTESSTKAVSKPTATVKPNIIENTNKIASPTKPMLKPIPKKTSSTKVLNMDIDLNKVPVTPLKRPSDGTSEILPKKAKIVPTTKPTIVSTTTGPSIKKSTPITNGTIKNQISDEDDELALFDKAFSSSTVPKKATSTVPPSTIQQFTARYTSLTSTSISQTTVNSNSCTRAETSNDGRRIAHQPKVHPAGTTSSVTPSLQPLVDPNSSINKIPFKTRQEYLTFFVNELKNQQSKTNDATPTAPIFSRAQAMEKEIFDKSTNKNSYLNLAAKNIRQLRSQNTTTKSTNEPSSSKKPTVQRLVVSHSAMLTAGKTENISYGIKKHKETDMKTLTEYELYTLLLVHKATERDLAENGYPAFSLDFPDKVLIKNKNPLYNTANKVISSDPFTRTCCRCGKTYKIGKEGEYIRQEECIYHWGRMRSQRVAGQIEKTFGCCSGKTNATGCTIANYHVHDGDDMQLLSGYVKTQPPRKPLGPNESYGIYAIDCEMCYTINGLELVRVSVINHRLQPIYETLVKPAHKVLDYNTRWSGITESQLKPCNVTLEDVQKHLLKLFNNKTILIGHSLESDLKALKIVHETIIDTSLVFPHPKGKPFKRALKTLMSEFLTKIIQERTDGHDSMEDAMSCMELMLWKVKQDLKCSTATR